MNVIPHKLPERWNGQEGRTALRDILVFLDMGSASAERLRLAKNIARDHEACLSAALLPDDPPSEFGRRAMPAETVKQSLRDRLLSFEGDWYPLNRVDTAEMISLARTADLIVMGQVNPYCRPAPEWWPEDIVVACGRPVLMVPYFGSYVQLGRRVLVAWDNSREASRALNDALPLISAAEAVTLMTVANRDTGSERERRTMDRMLQHLERHGINARAEVIPRGSAAISDMLLSRAVDFAVDLIVAGASHHSPLREALVGGVSRNLFQHMTVPVLMSH